MKTKAVRIHGKMDLRLDEIELPDIGPDGVRVEIVSDSICMSTYKAAVEGGEHKRVPDNVEENPTIVGHEFCGIIKERELEEQVQARRRICNSARAFLQGQSDGARIFVLLLRRRCAVRQYTDRDSSCRLSPSL